MHQAWGEVAEHREQLAQIHQAWGEVVENRDRITQLDQAVTHLLDQWSNDTCSKMEALLSRVQGVEAQIRTFQIPPPPPAPKPLEDNELFQRCAGFQLQLDALKNDLLKTNGSIVRQDRLDTLVQEKMERLEKQNVELLTKNLELTNRIAKCEKEISNTFGVVRHHMDNILKVVSQNYLEFAETRKDAELARAFPGVARNMHDAFQQQVDVLQNMFVTKALEFAE